MTWITAPLCETCWDHGNAGEGRYPVRVADAYRDAELCHVCRSITYSGIYVRAYYPPDNHGDGEPWEQPTTTEL
jgi:hypothetical protein